MTPERTEIVNGYKIEEIYWAGRFPVYIDNNLFQGNFEAAIEYCQNKEPKE